MAGARVMERYTENHIMMRDVTIPPTTSSSDKRRTQSPAKNRQREIWSKMGRKAAISNTFHFLRPNHRQYRIRVLERGAIFSCAEYSRNHCLTRIARDAVARLHTKAENHKELRRTEMGSLDVVRESNGNGVAVEFNASSVIVKPLNCCDICANSRTVVSEGSL